MSATVIDGGPAGPDEVGGQYRNRILTDRTAWWQALGARQGILEGFTWSVVAGQMALELDAGKAGVEERDTLGVADTGRGYLVWQEDANLATFGAPSASARNDAVVLAFVDVAVGTAALGTETSVVGGQIVVVPGVSGTTTPRTDSQIQAAVGSGGWVRVLDVQIDPADTEVNPANVTQAAGVYLTRTRMRTATGTISGAAVTPGSAANATINFGFTLAATPQAITAVVSGFVSGASAMVVRTVDQYAASSCRVAVVNTGNTDATFTNLPVRLLILE